MKSLPAILMTTAVLMLAPAAAWSDSNSSKQYEAPAAQSQHVGENVSAAQVSDVQAKRFPATPEPTRLALLAAGLIGVVLMRRIVSRAN